MHTVPLQLSDVIYNAANQSFEALVTVHDASGQQRYACAIDAPIDMEFKDAAQGLTKQALRCHGRSLAGTGVEPVHVPLRSARSGARRPALRSSFEKKRTRAA